MDIDWQKIQSKWQKKWENAELGKAVVNNDKPKFMMIFAYPGISGFLHVGHMRGFSYTDAICRYKRLTGHEVLYPVGTHASGNQAIAFANKVKNKDETWINYLLTNGCPKSKLKDLETPEKVIEYFNEVYVNDYWKKFGFLCDWDRFLCTSYLDYQKFMAWQFKKLMDNNLLVQKPYFATACIKCGPVAVDPSETDISKGGNAEKQEFTLLKFKLNNDKLKLNNGDNQDNNVYLIAATLRPETVFGQTNLWINPNVKYVKVKVSNEKDGVVDTGQEETWIMSQEGAEKLGYQKDDVLLGEDIDPKQLIGQYVKAPGIDREIIVLPSRLCNPKVGSGIVTSVPSDAPYDYVALKKLQEDKKRCEKFGLDYRVVNEIKLIPIIRSKSYGDFPAQEIVEKMGITSLKDAEKLEQATQEIYKAGFHTGVMRENCGQYAGKRVIEAKELVKAEMIDQREADILHDLSEEVICRCGEKVIIKRIDDQWFIRYSDEELTGKSKKWVEEMNIFPQEYKDNLPGILDWFSDRACARLGNWTGSKFPFDEQWTIEPISDSTLYPVYYIVSKFFNSGKIKEKDLTTEFFDYVFLGEGTGKKEWEEIKEEFDYFYPLDINLGGKEHKTVHFPVFLMNHVGIMPPEKWPKGIFVNWWVIGKGSKISKSKGGAVPIPEAMEKYGVDAMRLYYAHIGSPHVDVVWTEDIVYNYRNSLDRIFGLVEELKKRDGSRGLIDDWLLSRVNGHIKKTNSIMGQFDLRELATIVYYNFYDDLRWYLRRGGENQKIIEKVLLIWCKLMNPITPHLSEELNQELGSKQLVSGNEWPEVDEQRISLKAEAGEELVKKTITGMRKVIELSGLKKINKFTLFVAEKWLYDVFQIVKSEMGVTRNLGEIIKKVLEEEQLKVKGKEVSKVVGMLLKDVSKLPNFVLLQEEELKIIDSAQDFLQDEFKCPVEIVLAEESDSSKAKSALPGKVGILVE